MPPFSNKKKKEQLRLKRQLKKERADDPNSFYKTIMSRAIYNKGQPNSKNDQKGEKGREKFADLQFFKDDDDEIKRRKEDAQNPIVRLEPLHLEIDADSPAASLDMPKRPQWTRGMSIHQLNLQEQQYFRKFVNDILADSEDNERKLSYFDLNLETWRQLWRVIEMSEIITIIVDVRHPLFHFPPTLYNYIVNDLGKMVLIVLNKIDLVPACLVVAWMDYLKRQYPEVHIIPFASYAGMKSKRNGKRVGKLHMATHGSFRFMQEIQSMVGNQVDLTSWKQKIDEELKFDARKQRAKNGADLGGDEKEEQADDSDYDASVCSESESKPVSGGRENSPKSDDSDDDNDEAVMASKALRKAHIISEKNDTSYYQGEKFKNGLLTIGCVGHPNVGKSSFMNALIGRKVVSVSRTPGHTKHFQTIFLTQNVRLCDCPGLVFPSYYPKQLQVLMGCYPISQLREPYSSIQYMAERLDVPGILKLIPPEDFLHPAVAAKARKEQQISCQSSANDPSNFEWSSFSICESWAYVRGFLTARSGRPDVYRAANHLLRMALDGRTLCLSFYPPDYIKLKESHWEQHEQIDHIRSVQGIHNIVDDDEFEGWNVEKVSSRVAD